jgi:hypothetical protein
MRFRIDALVLALALPFSVPAQPQPKVIHLWTNGAPGFEARKDEPETARDWWVRNIHNPSVTVFQPACDQVSIDLLQKLRAAGVPVEAHFFARGKHAFNMGYRSEFLAVRNWPQRMADWLHDSGFLEKK